MGDICITNGVRRDTYAPEKNPNNTEKAIMLAVGVGVEGSQSARMNIPTSSRRL